MIILPSYEAVIASC